MSDFLDKKISANKNYLLIFGVYFLVRLLFVLIIVPRVPAFQFFADEIRYDRASDGILQGNFNFDNGMFITAPVFPFFLAFVKLIFGEYWFVANTGAQIILSSLSGIYLYKLTERLFSKKTAILAAVIFCFHPCAMWFIYSPMQEILCQFLLILFMYFFVKSLQDKRTNLLYYAAFLFSLCFLTKSFLLFYALFVPLVLFAHNFADKQSALKKSVIFASICVFMTLPFGLLNLKINNLYILSSSGTGYHFYLSNNEALYFNLTHPDEPKQDPPYFFGREFDERSKNTPFVPVKVREAYYAQKAIDWIRTSPNKFWFLRYENFKSFLRPGFNPNYHSRKIWLFSLLLALPLYIFAYLGILYAMRSQGIKKHAWFLALFLSMLLFSTFFYHQGRFRRVIMEPFYIIYGAYFLKVVSSKIKNFRQ